MKSRFFGGLGGCLMEHLLEPTGEEGKTKVHACVCVGGGGGDEVWKCGDSVFASLLLSEEAKAPGRQQ